MNKSQLYNDFMDAYYGAHTEGRKKSVVQIEGNALWKEHKSREDFRGIQGKINELRKHKKQSQKTMHGFFVRSEQSSTPQQFFKSTPEQQTSAYELQNATDENIDIGETKFDEEEGTRRKKQRVEILDVIDVSATDETNSEDEYFDYEEVRSMFIT